MGTSCFFFIYRRYTVNISSSPFHMSCCVVMKSIFFLFFESYLIVLMPPHSIFLVSFCMHTIHEQPRHNI
uniref:Uncharacterized protein n=1 Tax=Lepeophtheirus salmonis TaxID=72036 RepID=A0A0K2TUQ8_LEPSM